MAGESNVTSAAPGSVATPRANGTARRSAATRAPSSAAVLTRVVVYYVAVSLLGALAWRYLPRTRFIAENSLDALFGSAAQFGGLVDRKAAVIAPPVDQST